MVDDDGELCAELRRQHVKMHGDGKNQTTSVPFARDYSVRAGDLPEGSFILVAYKCRKHQVKTKSAPSQKKGAKQVRSCETDVFGKQHGVYVSRLEAHAQLAAFREIISGKGRGGGSKPLAQRNQPAQSPSPISTRSLTQTDDVGPERIDRIVHSCVERMVRAIVATTGVAADEFWSAGGNSALATVRRRAIDAVGQRTSSLLLERSSTSFTASRRETATASSPSSPPPPFYNIDAPRNDTWVTDKHGKQKLKPGFEGKAKGTKQIVWESGWWREGMIHDMSNSVMQSKKNTKNYTKADLATYVLSQRPDFREEISDLEQLMIRRGHILIMSVSGFVQSHHSLHSISSFLSPARASVTSQFVSSYADTNSCCTWCRSNVTLR